MNKKFPLSKSTPSQASNTIDEKHTEMLNRFHENDVNVIPSLLQEIEQLKSKAKNIQENPKNPKDLRSGKGSRAAGGGTLEEYMDIRDQIQAKKNMVKVLKHQKKQYLLDNSKYIFNYFEQKKDISTGGGKQNVNLLNSFFKISAKTPESETLQSDKYAQSKTIYQNYWKNVNNELVNLQDFVIPSDICEVCRKGELIPQDEEGIMICNNNMCGVFITYIVDSSKPSNKEPPNEVSYTAYIRLNHFKEILSQFQAKETTQIPDEVIEAIRARIKKERITDMRLINYDKMREILRKLGFNKYFEHIQYINSIFGIKPPIMNEELHETLCVLFIEIQKPWALHCPANRTNFFNYTYTLYQLCVLLDQTQYLPYIPMMKDREKQLEQDMIWKKVCNDLDWEFFPTV